MKEVQYGSEKDWLVFGELFGGEDNPFSLPRRWDGKAFYEDLDELLSYYQELIMDSSLNRNIYEKVKAICGNILNVIRTYLHGYPAGAYNKFTILMDTLKEQPMYANLDNIGNLYRMTKVDDNINDRARIFHAPYTVRTKVATYRYSIAGHPSLYLADSLALADLETSLFSSKEKAISARFNLCIAPKYKQREGIDPRDITIIELGFRPQDLATEEKETGLLDNDTCDRSRDAFYNSIKHSDDNLRSEGLSETYRCNAVERYILWFPLILACSYVRTNRSNPFAPEYIVPQLLTQWLRYNNTGRLIGIRYFSCYSKEASILGVNYVFPSSGEPIILRDGVQQYCPQLNEALVVTETEYLPDYQSLDKLEDVLSKEISKHVFKLTRIDYEEETTVRFPRGEMYIPARSFFNCFKLKTVHLTDAIVGIGDRAFHGCKSLETIRPVVKGKNTLPIQLETIGDGAFSGCSKLKSIILPEGLKRIGTWVFYGCQELEELRIPSTVETIGRGLVSGCNNMHSLVVNTNNSKFYSESNCIIRKSTKSLVAGICYEGQFIIPLGVTEIEDGAFSRNIRIKQLVISIGVKAIGEWAFEYCRNIETISFPDSIETVGAWAFQDCANLREVHFENNVKSIEYEAFAGCENLEKVFLPGSIENLGYKIFGNCTELRSIYYGGTKKAWDRIDKDDDWDFGTPNYTLYFIDDTTITKEKLHIEK